MRANRFVFAVFLPLFLAACAQTSLIDYTEQERVGFVIIGLSGNTPWTEMTSTDYKVHTYEYENLNNKDVILMPVSVGTRFQITEMSNDRSSKTLKHVFKGSPMLNIYKPKIYYYGVIHSYVNDNRQLRTKIKADIDPAVIEAARQKYPEVFKRKPDVQFRNDDLAIGLKSLKKFNYGGSEQGSMAKFGKSQNHDKSTTD